MAVDIAKLKEKLEQLNQGNGGGGGNMHFHTIADGRNVFRILPPAEGSDMFYEEVFLHYGVGKMEENKKGSTIVCPTTHGDHKPCPVCEVVKELRKLSKAKDDAYDKQARSLGRKKRVYYNAINRGDDLSGLTQNEEGKYIGADGKEVFPVAVLATGVTVFKDLLGFFVDPEYGDITDAEEGLDVIITRSGRDFNTSYDTKTVRKNSPIGFPGWKECLNDLSSLSKAKTYKEIQAILDGEDPDEAEEGKDADKAAPATGKATTAATKPAPAVDEEAPAKEEATSKDDTPPAGDDATAEDDLQAEIRAAMSRRSANQ